MTNRDRFKLLFGPYRTPRFQFGDLAFCNVRGQVKIVGLTDARIPWPKGRTGKRSRAIVLYGVLAQAVRRESAQAVAYWWGVGQDTVCKWRKALGVPAVNEGTQRLKRDHALEPKFRLVRNKARAKARDPIRRSKIAAAKRGIPRPRHVIEAVRAANLGRKLSEETRHKISLAHKRRGTRPPKAGRPWKKWEERLLWIYCGTEVARQTGRSLSAVYSRRRAHGLPDGRRNLVGRSQAFRAIALAVRRQQSIK